MDIEDAKGNSPLHYAAQAGNLKIIYHLCKTRDANPMISNFQNQIPRAMASDAAIRTYLEDQEEKYKAKHGQSFVQRII